MYDVYIDASFDKNSKLAVGGYLFNGTIQTMVLKDTNNISAEIITSIWTMKSIDVLNLTIFTDCQSILQLFQRRSRLESKNYWSNRSQKQLEHTELYKEFFTIVDKYLPRFVKIKGHTSKPQTINEQEFARIDQHVRHQLRNLIR